MFWHHHVLFYLRISKFLWDLQYLWWSVENLTTSIGKSSKKERMCLPGWQVPWPQTAVKMRPANMKLEAENCQNETASLGGLKFVEIKPRRCFRNLRPARCFLARVDDATKTWVDRNPFEVLEIRKHRYPRSKTLIFWRVDSGLTNLGRRRPQVFGNSSMKWAWRVWSVWWVYLG